MWWRRGPLKANDRFVNRPTAHYILDHGWWPITASYAFLGEKEGWLVMVDQKVNAHNVITNFYSHIR